MDPKEALQVLLDDGYKPDMAERVIAQLQAEGKVEPYDSNTASAPRPPAAIYTGPTADVDTPGSQGYTDLSNFIPTGRRSQTPSTDVIEQANVIAKSMFGKDYGFTAFAGQEPPSAMLAGSRLNHPNGVAADGYLTYKGEPVKDDAKAKSFMQGWLGANPGGSVGYGKGYMDRVGYPNASNMHIQTNRGLQWGRGGRTANIDPALSRELTASRQSGQLPFSVLEDQKYLPNFRPENPLDMIVGNPQPSAGTPTSRGQQPVGVNPATGRPDMATGVPTLSGRASEAEWTEQQMQPGSALAPDVQTQIASDLRQDFDLTDEQIAGVLGNFNVETAGFTTLAEKGKGTRGYGWSQWSNTRRDAFDEWVAEKGLPRDSYAANYGFLAHEFNTTEKKALADLKEAKTAKEAATVFEDKFERAGTPHLDRRISAAEDMLGTIQAQSNMDPAFNYQKYGEMQGRAPTQPTPRGTPQQIASGNATTRGAAPPADLNALTPLIAAGNATTRGIAPPALAMTAPTSGNAQTRGIAPPQGAPVTPVTRGPDLPPASPLQSLLNEALNYAPAPDQIPMQLDSGLRTSQSLLQGQSIPSSMLTSGSLGSTGGPLQTSAAVRGQRELPAEILQSSPMAPPQAMQPSPNTAPARSVPTTSFNLPTEDATAQQLTDRLGELNASPLAGQSTGDRAEQLSELFSLTNAARAAESNAAIDAAAQEAAQARISPGNATTRGAAPPPSVGYNPATGRPDMATGVPSWRPGAFTGGATPATPTMRPANLNAMTGGAPPATPTFRPDTLYGMPENRIATPTPRPTQIQDYAVADLPTPTPRHSGSHSTARRTPASTHDIASSCSG